MPKVLRAALLCLACGGCFHHGMSDTQLRQKLPAGGVSADVELRRAARPRTVITGELIEARDSALLLLRSDGFYVVPYPDVNVVRIRRRTDTGSKVIRGDAAGLRAQLRAHSRFPFGLTDDVLAQLLSRYGQVEPRRIQR